MEIPKLWVIPSVHLYITCESVKIFEDLLCQALVQTSRRQANLLQCSREHMRRGPWADGAGTGELVHCQLGWWECKQTNGTRWGRGQGVEGSHTPSRHLEDYDLFYLALNERMIQWKSLSSAPPPPPPPSTALISMLNMCVWESRGVCVCECESVCALTDDKFLEICQHLGKDAQVLEGLPGWGA